jgi:hypothetical protein
MAFLISLSFALTSSLKDKIGSTLEWDWRKRVIHPGKINETKKGKVLALRLVRASGLADSS